MTRRLTRLVAALPAATLAMSAAGCSGSSGPHAATTPSQSTTARPSTVTVFAAASLTNVFAAEAAAYQRVEHVRVRFSFAGSQDLVAQIRQGAPADVIATADLTALAPLSASLPARPQVFARNRLVIVTAPGNPKHIASLRDLARRSLIVVLAAPSVPAGKYAARALAAAHVTVHPRSLEDNVRGVLTKVELGEADAGIVYVTDALSAGRRVGTVSLASSPIASYAVDALDTAGRPFVTFLLSTPGQAILRRFGFLPPP